MAAYVEPVDETGNPVPPLTGTGVTPGTAPTFLNGSSVPQLKEGSLVIGSNGRSSKFCLNAYTDRSIYDATNNDKCIDAWSDLSAISGVYVTRKLNANTGDPALPASYQAADRGFATVIGNGANNQYLSTVVKTTAGSFATKYAVYATDGGDTNARYAAQFSGKTVIRNSTNDAQLCLNGACIDAWSDTASFVNAQVVRLQSSTYLTPDLGHASVNGVLFLQRGLTVGRPTAITSYTLTNTDGHCTAENGETTGNSPLDCN